jgi:hypothetical protein
MFVSAFFIPFNTALVHLLQFGVIKICDLAMAFDFVNLEDVLATVNFYGIRGVSDDWFLFK